MEKRGLREIDREKKEQSRLYSDMIFAPSYLPDSTEYSVTN